MKTAKAISYFLDSRRAKGLSEQTIRWYRGILDMFAETYPNLPEKPELIEAFLADCTAGDERRHGYFRALKALYRFLRRRYKVKNAFEFIEAPKRRRKKPKPLTLDALDQLLSYPHINWINAALMVLTDTGVRVSEAAKLELSDLIQTPWGHIARIDGKTGERLVPIREETYNALSKVLPFRVTPYRFRRKISVAFKDAKVRGSGINLRHTFGTYFEGDELILQQIMGHAHLSTTRGYRELRMRVICEQHHKYSPLGMVYSRTKSMF